MHLVIQFIRGPRDGELLVGDPASGVLDEATALYRALIDDFAKESIWIPTEYAVGILSTPPERSIQTAIAVGCRFPDPGTTCDPHPIATTHISPPTNIATRLRFTIFAP